MKKVKKVLLIQNSRTSIKKEEKRQKIYADVVKEQSDGETYVF